MPRREVVTLKGPFRGLHDARTYADQLPLSTVHCKNVRPHQPTSGRGRIAMRPGLSLYAGSNGSFGESLQCLAWTLSQGDPDTDSDNPRTLTILGVGAGVVHRRNGPNEPWTRFIAAGQSLNSSVSRIGWTRLFEDIYFADGSSSPKFYDVSAGELAAWEAGEKPANEIQPAGVLGEVPTGCRLAATWRGRIVLSGDTSDPTNWFMSAVGDPNDWDYNPFPPRATQAVAGNNAEVGQIPDIVTALMPLSDDELMFGCSRSIWVMRGDPADGGSLIQISDGIGAAFGDAWCQSPDGTLYFAGSQGGIFRWRGRELFRMDREAIPFRLNDIDYERFRVSLAWNIRENGLHVFVTDLTEDDPSNHFWWDQRTESWWRDVFGREDGELDPWAVEAIDADDPDAKQTVLAARDGGLYFYDVPEFSTDLGFDIQRDHNDRFESEVILGPFGPYRNNVVEEIEMFFGHDTEEAAFDVLGGETHEAALGEFAS